MEELSGVRGAQKGTERLGKSLERDQKGTYEVRGAQKVSEGLRGARRSQRGTAGSEKLKRT